MKIELCISKNQSLSKKFPKDPDYDFIIKCNDTQFMLQIAFLYLQSNYFDSIDQKEIKQIELHQLDQDALKTVLYVLYGGQITVKSFDKLTKIYQIIISLQVQYLRQAVVSQLQQQLMSLNPIELLQFSLRYNVLNVQTSEIILANDAQILRDPMFSMQLNKLSSKNLNTILLQYYSSKSQSSGIKDKQEKMKVNISGILSDYFHNNKIKPQEYFEEYKVDILRSIWFQNHPQFIAQTMYDSQGLEDEQQQKIHALMEEVKELEATISKYNEKILKLEQENAHLKQRQLHNSLNFKNEQEQTRIQKINSPFKMGELSKVPTTASYQVPEDDDNLSFGRRINQTSGAKFLQTVKDKNRNNSYAKK